MGSARSGPPSAGWDGTPPWPRLQDVMTRSWPPGTPARLLGAFLFLISKKDAIKLPLNAFIHPFIHLRTFPRRPPRPGSAPAPTRSLPHPGLIWALSVFNSPHPQPFVRRFYRVWGGLPRNQATLPSPADSPPPGSGVVPESPAPGAALL